MILLKHVEIYAPEYLGCKDILLSNKIEMIRDNIDSFDASITVIDCSDKILAPGLIDQHVHITGGGGEGSFKTRVPEITLSKLIEGGITTVVGLLGTDSTTRSVENLVAKSKALKEEGISVYAITGSYEYPTITLTDSIKKDICFIEEIIGGKVALSDHRSSSITIDDLGKLASDIRVSGMLSGKAGILVSHMGEGSDGLQPVFDVLESTEVPVKTIRPTHVNRNSFLLNQGLQYTKLGGLIDLTCSTSELRPGNVIKNVMDTDIPMEHITVSSDGYGSWSRYDDKGNLIEIGVASVSNLLRELRYMVNEKDIPLDRALPFFTSNVAKGLSLYPTKGCIQEGADADMILLDKSMGLDTVIALGTPMMLDMTIKVKGTYE